MKKHFEIRESSSSLRVWYPFNSVWAFSFNNVLLDAEIWVKKVMPILITKSQYSAISGVLLK